MTKDEIIKLARVAGVRDDGHRFEFSEYKYLERFAALVAEQEREACAAMFDDRNVWDEEVGERIRARGDK